MKRSFVCALALFAFTVLGSSRASVYDPMNPLNCPGGKIVMGLCVPNGAR